MRSPSGSPHFVHPATLRFGARPQVGQSVAAKPPLPGEEGSPAPEDPPPQLGQGADGADAPPQVGHAPARDPPPPQVEHPPARLVPEPPCPRRWLNWFDPA